MFERVLKAATLLSVAAALVAVDGGTKAFSAGNGESCVHATEQVRCDGVRGHNCKSGGNKCITGSAFSSCTNGTGGSASDCEIEAGCKHSGQTYATTNSTGC